jgi:hypothetical protein
MTQKREMFVDLMDNASLVRPLSPFTHCTHRAGQVVEGVEEHSMMRQVSRSSSSLTGRRAEFPRFLMSHTSGRTDTTE